MPPDGDGMYYFSTYLLVPDSGYGMFDMRLNDDVICSTFPDHAQSGTDVASGSCSAIVDVVAGTAYFNGILFFRITRCKG